jgi:hypothetical protein
MKLLKNGILFLLLQLLLGCSWIEHFMVINESDQPIEVTYTLETPKETFAIFDYRYDVYAIKKPGQIDWNKKMEINDLDTSFQTIHIQLPPKATLIFGSLHNDNYTTYNQYFINGRSFNLIEITVKTAKETIVVKPETFDTFFKKKNGSISYVVR